MGITEENSVTTKTRDKYKKAVKDFLMFVGATSLAMPLDRLDAKAVSYCDHRFLEGKGVGAGSTLLAGLQFSMPDVSRNGWLHVPRFGRALKGWSRLAPTATRQPLPWMVCAAIAHSLLEMASIAHCLAWLLMVDCYLRPSEALKLRCEQFVLPVRSRYKVALHLNPRKYRERSKTGELDESVVVSRRWLSDALAVYIGKRPAGLAFGSPWRKCGAHSWWQRIGAVLRDTDRCCTWADTAEHR